MNIFTRTLGDKRDQFTGFLAALYNFEEPFALFIALTGKFSQSQKLLISAIQRKGNKVFWRTTETPGLGDALYYLFDMAWKFRVENMLFVDDDVIFNEQHVRDAMGYNVGQAVSYYQWFSHDDFNDLNELLMRGMVEPYFMYLKSTGPLFSTYTLEAMRGFMGIKSIEFPVFTRIITEAYEPILHFSHDAPMHLYVYSDYTVNFGEKAGGYCPYEVWMKLKGLHITQVWPEAHRLEGEYRAKGATPNVYSGGGSSIPEK
jgi:hypothetical protein